MLKRSKPSINNEKGMAAFEMIPILVVIVLFVNFSLGFFGAIHTGILNSIASRNYAFETFRHRANLIYFRNNSPRNDIHFEKIQMRVHRKISDKDASRTDEPPSTATARTIDFMPFDKRAAEDDGFGKAEHDKTREVPAGRNTTIGVNPIWIKTAYGICLSASCGS